MLVLTLYEGWNQREEHHPPGILVPEEPLQTTETKSRTVKFKNTALDLLAEYKIRARILSTHRYFFDSMAKVAPVDLAVGWGVMSDSSVLKKLSISQDDRFYFYFWKGPPPVEASQMAKHSANMHLLPATAFVEDQIKSFRVGQIITLQGHLVRVNFPNGATAKSSLTRDDTGPGACEIMWVEMAQAGQ